jgi:hypothetical protein
MVRFPTSGGVGGSPSPQTEAPAQSRSPFLLLAVPFLGCGQKISAGLTFYGPRKEKEIEAHATGRRQNIC